MVRLDQQNKEEVKEAGAKADFVLPATDGDPLKEKIKELRLRSFCWI